MTRNVNNSLRTNNPQVLGENKSSGYSKRYIDSLIHKAIYNPVQVNLIRLSDEDITSMKIGKKSKRPNEDVIEILDAPELNKSNHKGKKSNETSLELVSSSESKSQFQTMDMENCKKRDMKENKKNAKKIKNNNNKDTENKDNKDNIIIIDDESSNSSIEFIEITHNNPLEAKPPTSTSKIGKIRCCDINKLLETPMVEKSSETNSNNSSLQNALQINSLSLSEIECIYHKYYPKSVRDNVVIITNILNIMSISNTHQKLRMHEINKIKTEADKLKRRSDANKSYSRHKTILESKLKKYFLEVLSRFAHSEFELAFQMFFLGILILFRELKQPKIKNGNTYKYLILLLQKSLKNAKLDHPKVFEMFGSNDFHPDCIDLLVRIEENQDNDPDISDRMSLFFKPSVNSKNYFERVENTVTSESSDEDLASLIDLAAVLCYSKYIVTSTSTPKNDVFANTPLTPVASTSKSKDSYNRLILVRSSNGTYQPLDKSIKITSITQPSNSTQPCLYRNVSNNLARPSTATVVPLTLVPLVPNMTRISTPPTISNGQLQNSKSFITFQQPIRNVGPVSTNFPKIRANTIFVVKKVCNVVRSPMNSTRADTPQGGIVVESTNPVRRQIPSKCDSNFCQNTAKIMCSECRSVRYCSFNCQRLDWSNTHMENCQRLKDINKSRRENGNGT